MSEREYFGPEKKDRFFIELLVTQVHRIFVTKELLQEMIEGHLHYIAPEHARIAMSNYDKGFKSKDLTPMELFDRSQTMAWDEILDRPLAPLNGLRSGLGEHFDHVTGSGAEMHKDRTAAEWSEIIGLPIKSPTFLEAVTMWVLETEQKARSEENNG